MEVWRVTRVTGVLMCLHVAAVLVLAMVDQGVHAVVVIRSHESMGEESPKIGQISLDSGRYSAKKAIYCAHHLELADDTSRTSYRSEIRLHDWWRVPSRIDRDFSRSAQL